MEAIVVWGAENGKISCAIPIKWLRWISHGKVLDNLAKIWLNNNLNQTFLPVNQVNNYQEKTKF